MHTNYEVVGGYLSPVSDAYEKPDLASARDRLQMCDIAVRTASDWLTLDSWEAKQKEYSRTAVVLDHFDYEVNKAFNDNHENDKNNNLADQQEGPRRVHVALLAGADLIGTMSTPGVWSESDLEHILGRYGAFIVEREGTDIDKALSHLQRWKDNIHVINQPIRNDVSSTKIRQNLKKDMSVEYLIPGEVITYIRQHGLYRGDSAISSIHRRGNRLGISHSEATSDSEGSHG
ncbi:hypothetical protein MMC13_002879 [Lambiella insularis]|nr:hypothetical protein [Lambiella insularis]